MGREDTMREDTHKKSGFFSGRTTKDLTPPPNGLVVHATYDKKKI